MKRLEGKIAIVTGASTGIGKGIAKLFAAEGAKVVFCASGRNPDLSDAVLAEIRAAGGDAAYKKCDVLLKEDIASLVQFTVDTYGKPDILVNNAVVATQGNVVDVSEEDWNVTLTSSITAVMRFCKLVIPLMQEKGGGSIINLSSIHGLLGGRDYIVYDTAKAGLINMTRQMAADYGPYNVRVNAICPGRIVTEKKVDFLAANPEEYRRQKSVYPLGRPGTVEECAYPALFLASEESSFITGHALVVDGGLTAQLQDMVAIRIEEGIYESLKEKK